MAAHWQFVLTLLTAFGLVGAVLVAVPVRPSARSARDAGWRYALAAGLIVAATAATTAWIATVH